MTRVATSPGLSTAVLRACARMALTDKELADHLHISPSQWAKQKQGKDGHRMHVQRFDALPDPERALFLDALLDELARLRGRTVVRVGGQLAAVANMMRAAADAMDQTTVMHAPTSAPPEEE